MVNIIIRVINKVRFMFSPRYRLEVRYKKPREDLVERGLKLGKNVILSPSVTIDKSYPYMISIGDNCVICSGTRLIAHDATAIPFNGGYMRLGKIDIKENCIIGVNVIILPGITIGPNSMVASGSMVNKDIPPNTCVAGVPARFFMKFDKWMEEMKDEISNSTAFASVDIYRGMDDKDQERKKKMIEQSRKGNVWIEGRESKNEKIVREYIYGKECFKF